MVYTTISRHRQNRRAKLYEPHRWPPLPTPPRYRSSRMHLSSNIHLPLQLLHSLLIQSSNNLSLRTRGPSWDHHLSRLHLPSHYPYFPPWVVHFPPLVHHFHLHCRTRGSSPNHVYGLASCSASCWNGACCHNPYPTRAHHHQWQPPEGMCWMLRMIVAQRVATGLHQRKRYAYMIDHLRQHLQSWRDSATCAGWGLGLCGINVYISTDHHRMRSMTL